MPGFLHVTAADISAVGPEAFLCVVGIALFAWLGRHRPGREASVQF